MASVGDEIVSLIIDCGSRWLRVGYSGDDKPHVTIPSQVGKSIDGKCFYGELQLSSPRPGMEIIETCGAETILEWSLFEGLLDHAVTKIMDLKWEEYPVLLVDNPFWSGETREKLVKLFFDKFQVPAFFLGRSPVLGAFSQGKHTGMVVDLGSSALRVYPVNEGYILMKSIQKEIFLGGTALDEECHKLLVDELKIGSLDIPQQIASKKAVKLASAPEVELKMIKGLTESFTKYHQQAILRDFKEANIEVSESVYDAEKLSIRPAKFYEFPNGYNRNFTLERYRIGEQFFDPSSFKINSMEEGVKSIENLILTALDSVEIDAKSGLLQNVLLTGGGSSIPGLGERLEKHLGADSRIGRVRVNAGSTVQERIFSNWIGGSILASLGSFQQLWLTKQEYKEHGASYIDRKCP